MDKLIFGTAGIPISTEPRTTENGIKQVKKLGLGAMELEFVRSINITKEKAPNIKTIAESEKIVLTCHAPYYINLNSMEKAKLEASKKRIIDSARIAKHCGAWSVCFHPGFYMKLEKEKVYEKIKGCLSEIVSKLKSEQNNIWIRPETMGKHTSFGTLNEILKLSSELDNVMPCIDFAHLHALNGKNNTYNEFCDILGAVEKVLGKKGLQNIHAHVSGINYTEEGERNHLCLQDSDFNYKELIRALKEYKTQGVVISESPNIEQDALLMKKLFY